MRRINFLWLLLSIIEVKGSSYRLPDDVEPISYDLRMAIDPANSTFAAEVDIRVHVKYPTDRIILHSSDLKIRSVKVSKSQGSTNDTASNRIAHELDESNQILTIRSDRKFEVNTDYNVFIAYEGKQIDSVNDGPVHVAIHRHPDRFYHHNNLWKSTAYRETTGARKFVPCFDEPRYKATFNISLARPQNYSAISNMPREAVLPSDSLSNGLIWDKFQPTPPIPTYLVFYMVTNLNTVNSKDKRLTAKMRYTDSGRSTLKQAEKLLKYFEDYTRIPYSLPRLEIIVLREFPGTAVDYTGGLIVCDELFFDRKELSEQYVSTTGISNELAHFWLRDMTNMSWDNDLWLEEGFARYFQFFGAVGIEPSWDLESIFVLTLTQKTLFTEAWKIKNMTKEFRDFDEFSSTNLEISNNKAACMIRMFEQMVSPKTFRNAFHNYLKNGQQYQPNTTVLESLYDTFDKQIKLDSVSHLPPQLNASDIMKTWIDTEGYPLINVVRSYKKGEVVITQTPYKSSSCHERAKNDQKWVVPLTYTTKSQLKFTNVLPTHWSFADEPTVLSGVAKEDWILFNLKQSGYYRVNYDIENWQLLIQQLKSKHNVINPLNRAQLIDDATALALDAKLEFPILISLLEYLKKETNVVPLLSGAKSLVTLALSFPPESRMRRTFKEYFVELFENTYQDLACKIPIPDEPYNPADPIGQIFKERFLYYGQEIFGQICREKYRFRSTTGPPKYTYSDFK